MQAESVLHWHTATGEWLHINVTLLTHILQDCKFSLKLWKIWANTTTSLYLAFEEEEDQKIISFKNMYKLSYKEKKKNTHGEHIL